MYKRQLQTIITRYEYDKLQKILEKKRYLDRKKNQTYYMGICGYDCYSKGKYSERKYNEYILSSKDVLIKFFEMLKYSDYSVSEPFDYISLILLRNI